jgi:hypothetical protein
MAGLRASYAVCVLIIFVLLVSHSFGQTLPLLRVDEQQIKFRLDSHPVLELPIVNTSNRTLVGDFRLVLEFSDEIGRSDRKKAACESL